MNAQQALYRLQTIETSLDHAKKRLAEIEDLLNNHEAIQNAKQAYDNCQAEHHLAQTKSNNLDLELTALIQKIKDTDELLYSGRLTNPRELQDREAELASLKNRKTKLEADVAEARQAEQVAHHSMGESQNFLQAVQEEVAAQNKDLVKEDEKLRGKMGGWLKERKTTLEEVPQEDYKLYKQLKPQKNGVAVVRLNGVSCSFCQVEQTEVLLHQIRHKKVVAQCNSCARILVDV